MKTNKKSNRPPATRTVVDALTATPPTVWGRKFQPVTIAHVVVLEKLGCQLVLMQRPPTSFDHLLAVEVLTLDGPAALEAAQEPAKLHAAAEARSLVHRPAELREVSKAVFTWLNAAYDTHVSPGSEAGSPLPDSPGGVDSAGRSN